MDALTNPHSLLTHRRVNALNSALLILGAFFVSGCADEPHAASKQDLESICGRLHSAAREGRAEDFLAASHAFVGDPTLLSELLQRLEGGSYEVARLDEEMGALDLGVQLLAERSTALHPQLREEREAYLNRAVECLSALPPAYAHAMVNRWGQWGFFAPDHGPALVRLAPHPECRAIVLHELAEFGPANSLGPAELDLLTAVYDTQSLDAPEKANLLSVLLKRADEHDVRRAVSFIKVLDSGPPRWDLLSKLLVEVEREGVVRQIIDGISELSWATQPGNWSEIVPTNAVVGEIAVALYLEQPDSPRGRAAFALALHRRTFLESVHEHASDIRDRLLAVEMLIRHHLTFDEAIALTELTFAREAAQITADSSAASRFLGALASLTTRALQGETSGRTQSLKSLLQKCSTAIRHPEQAQSVATLIRLLDEGVDR